MLNRKSCLLKIVSKRDNKLFDNQKKKNINNEKVAIVEKYDTNMFHSLERKLDTVSTVLEQKEARRTRSPFSELVYLLWQNLAEVV